MRLDAVPEGLLEQAAFASGVVPTSMVRVVWSSAMMRAILAGLELGLYDALDEQPGTAEELADRLGADPRGLAALLAGLNGFGTVRRTGGRYALSREASRHLASASAHSLVDAVALGRLLDDRLSTLTEAVRTGERTGFHDSLSEPEWRTYLRGLGAMAKLPAAEVARALRLKSAERVLDVGGGHGAFSVALCSRHPELRATVLDLPGGAAVGRELVSEAGFDDRVAFVEGDLRTAPWGEGYDAVLLCNVLHNLRQDECRDAVKRAFGALRPGGTVVVVDAEQRGSEGNLSFQEGYGVLLFYLLSDAETWPEPSLREWLAEAGFTGVKRRRLFTLPGELMLVGQRPS